MSKAYAKINLGLLIHNKRPDGYHNIETVFHRINVFDEIFLKEDSGIHVDSSAPEVPGDESNLCYRAAILVKQELGVETGVTITLNKKIPVGAGLGGGSSDAATVLQTLPRFWGSRLSQPTLLQMALQLGSDVPFFLEHGSAVGRGRGEVLERFELDVPFTILLCNPNIHVATSWAYRQVKPRGENGTVDLRTVVLRGMSEPQRLVTELKNDFEPAVFGEYPDVRNVKDEMMTGGAVFASMSGSGSSVYGFFARREQAQSMSACFDAKGYRTFLTEPHFSPE